MSPADISTAPNWSFRADEAARSVTRLFGQRLFFLPGTHIAAITRPSGRIRNLTGAWHYWWQAHYVDCLVDTGRRELGTEARPGTRFDGENRPSAGRLASRLVTGIRLRNFFTYVNDYYDDMAWLALAATRLNELSLQLTSKPARLARFAVRSLTKQLHKAHDPVLGGGLYWSRKRDYKNTPVNGPAAAHFARLGELQIAGAVADWLRTELFDAETGLYLDGIHPSTADRDPELGRDVEAAIYTYNQGPILGALLKLGRPQDLIDAATLIDAIGRHLHTPGQGLRLEPGGDGSLFTGILCRYLALAVQEERLPAHSRAMVEELIQETASTVANEHPEILSAAIQRWTILNAAAAI